MEQIFKGFASNDKTGTPARQAADIINANFEYLDKKIKNPNSVLVNAGYTQTGNQITINVGWRWLINNVIYENSQAVSIIIPVSAAGFKRIDHFVATTSNTFMRVAGIENQVPVAPAAVHDTIVIAFSVVNDNAVAETGTGSQGSQSFYPASEFKFIQKGYGNTDLQNQQIGDIYCGWSNDGTIRYAEAKWLGGLKNNSNNFTPLLTIIIES